MTTKEKKYLNWIKKYLRYTDYLGAAQLYLKENCLLTEDLKPEHIKPRVLGHWGTVPGLNLIYAGLNYIAKEKNSEILLVTGPGHGAPAILANLFAEGTLNEFYKDYPVNEKGTNNIVHDFSWPQTPFPSHVTPTVPGSILEGGELGYSLATAYGAALDNPNLIAAVVVGDGESETGPIAAAWNSNKFLNPKTSGAVLPILHVNGYKISNPTIFASMSDKEIEDFFHGYGYDALIVGGGKLELKYLQALEKAHSQIKKIQKKTRNSKKSLIKPRWPVVVLKSPKGWKGPEKFHGHPVEGSFHSHGIPFGNPKKNPDEFKIVEKWLKSYKVHQLVDEKGQPIKEVMEFVPTGKYRLGMCKHAIGGSQTKDLKLPNSSKYAVKFKKRGSTQKSSMKIAGEFFRDTFKNNKKNFRMFCPDEMLSNKLNAVFQETKRAYMWPLKENDELMHPEGRVMEVLSEHTLQGWMQGYLLTGRHGVFVSYEAFTTIINSMVDQYAKFIKQSFNIKWRKPIPSAIYLQSSVGWRQDHNGFSHQNPSFVSNVLQKHGEFCQIYYPADANSMLVALEETMQRKDSICVIVAGKRDLPQWLTLKEAREQAKVGIGIWDWVGGKKASKNPDVVLASAGDYITQEAILAVKMVKKLVPEIKVRYVNVSELTSMCLGDYCAHPGSCLTQTGVDHYFTKDKPVVFSYHGYINDVEQILWPYSNAERFTLRGYQEQGSTTTAFDMKIRNGVSCFHLAKDLVKKAAKNNKKIAKKCDKIVAQIHEEIINHQKYIIENGDDPDSIKNLKW